jgi:hypothetical protein
MQPQREEPMSRTAATANWTRASQLAVAVTFLAVAIAVGALAYGRRSERLLAEVELQAVLVETYQNRALDCLDLARIWMDDAAQRRRAQLSLDLSKGITLCLVKARDAGRISVGALGACIREVETANTVIDVTLGGAGIQRPAC